MCKNIDGIAWIETSTTSLPTMPNISCAVYPIFSKIYVTRRGDIHLVTCHRTFSGPIIVTALKSNLNEKKETS